MKLNAKKVAVAIACLLLLIPVTVAQPQSVQAKAICVDGELKGVRLRITTPGTYTIMFHEGICEQPSREEVTT